VSKLIAQIKVQIALSLRGKRKAKMSWGNYFKRRTKKNMGDYTKLIEAEKVWDGVEMCDCADPVCGCTPIKSEIAALRYALSSYWLKRVKPISKVMLPEFERQYGKWTHKKSWRNFVMDVFSQNNLKAVEIIDAYEPNRNTA